MNGEGAPKAPYGFVASADSKYLRTFGGAFVASALRTDNPVHLHIVNADDEDRRLLAIMSDYHPKFSWTTKKVSLAPDPRVTYATARYLLLPWLFDQNPSYRAFIMDIDSLFMKKFEFLPTDNPIGLYFRDPVAAGARTAEEMLGMRVLAVCWIWGEAREYTDAVCAYLRKKPQRWFIDQEALAVTYDQFRDRIPATDLSRLPLIDWTMVHGTTIWTGKGPRKVDNSTYVAAFHDAREEFEEATGYKCLPLK